MTMTDVSATDFAVIAYREDDRWEAEVLPEVLTSDLNGVPNLSATIQPDGTLKINAASGYTVSFGEDTSGTLATLGINTYFTGTDASNILIPPPPEEAMKIHVVKGPNIQPPPRSRRWRKASRSNR